MRKLRNDKELINELTELLIKYAKEAHRYQTDIYLYYDEEEQIGEIKEYVNVGGNRWLNDNHYVIGSDWVHDETAYDTFPSVSDLASAADPEHNPDKLIRAAASALDIDEEDLEYSDLVEYIKQHDELQAIIYIEHCKEVEEHRSDYMDQAEMMLVDWMYEEEENELMRYPA